MNNSWLQSIVLSRGQGAFVYQQLLDHIRAGIADGKLKTGEVLPTSRRLAEQLGVNRNTVVRAYRDLQAQGILVGRVGSGTVVGKGLQVEKATPGSSQIAGLLLSQAAYRLEECRSVAVDATTIQLGRMIPSDDLMPVQAFAISLAAVLRRQPADLLGYAPPTGVRELREWIVGELKRLGVQADPESVLVTSGSSQALDLLLRLLIEPGDRILLEDPTYYAGIHLLRFAGAHLVPLPCDSQGPDLERLPNVMRGDAKLCYLIPNFRNPTGSSISLKRREQVAQWAVRNNILIVEDDYGAELGLEEKPAPPLKSLAPEQVIYLNSFSKRLLPGLRIGYMVVPSGPLREKLCTLKSLVDLGGTALLQYALVDFLNSDRYPLHLSAIRKEYRLRRDAMHAALEQVIPESVRWHKPTGGLFFWLQLPARIQVERLLHECAARGVEISGGDLWSATGAKLAGIRLTFCRESIKRIQDGVRIVAGVINEMLDQATPVENQKPQV